MGAELGPTQLQLVNRLDLQIIVGLDDLQQFLSLDKKGPLGDERR